jgi:hypothetical protein
VREPFLDGCQDCSSSVKCTRGFLIRHAVQSGVNAQIVKELPMIRRVVKGQYLLFRITYILVDTFICHLFVLRNCRIKP